MSTQNVDRDAWYFFDGGTKYGNGVGNRMSVGHSSAGGGIAGQHRCGVRIPRGTLFDGVPNADAITSFVLKVRIQSGCTGLGGAVRILAERVTPGEVHENAYSVECGLNTGGDVDDERWGGPATTTTDRGGYSGAPAANAWIAIDLLALGKWWYANPSVTALSLVLKAANAGLTDYDESTDNRRASFYTRHTASVPYAELAFNSNLAPYAPTDLAPADGSTIGSTAGTQAAVQFRHTDPEANSATKYEAAWYPASATDEVPGTPTKDDVITATTAHNALRSHTFTGLPARTAGRWRARFYDGQWGPWSLMQDATTAYQPGTPSGISIEAGTQTPDIGANLVSSDPADFVTAMEVNIYQDLGGGSTITKWASGKQSIGGSPSRGELTSGVTLDWDQPYRLQVRLWNRDDVASAFSGDVAFTQHAPVGPIISVGGIPAGTTVKQDDTTPTFTFTRSGGGNLDQLRVQYLNEAGDLLYDTGITSFAAASSRTDTPPAGTWDWSQKPKLRAAIRNSGESSIGPWSDPVQIRLNYTPGAPTPLSITHATDQVVLRSDGVYVADTATPTLVLPFVDQDKIDGYAEAPSWQQVEVRTLADAHFASSPYTDTTTPAETFVLPTLTAETTYKVRGKYRDSAAVESAFSDYLFVKRSAKPTLSSVLPANAATITDPTPAFSWVFASSGGKAQARWLLQVLADGDEVYNSGLVDGDDAEVVLPPDLLDTGQSIAWHLEVYDEDGLYATVDRTATTSFSAPAELTGLVIAQDEDAQGLVIEWDASALSDDEFVAYHVYARPATGGDFALIATLTDKASPALLYKAAPHNTEVIIRVTQDNGWAESAPAEESATLVASGYWLKDATSATRLPDGSTDMRGGTRHGPGDTQARLEVLEPLGRSEKVVLNWGATGYEGSIRLTTRDRALIERLRTWKDASTVVLLSTPYGASRYIKLLSTPDTDEPAAWIDASIGYLQVAASAATF